MYNLFQEGEGGKQKYVKWGSQPEVGRLDLETFKAKCRDLIRFAIAGQYAVVLTLA